MEVDKVANMVVDMVVDLETNKVDDKLADMVVVLVVDMMVDMELDKVLLPAWSWTWRIDRTDYSIIYREELDLTLSILSCLQGRII